MDALHRWFQSPLGQAVVDAECRFLSNRLAGMHARTVLQIGSFGQGQRPTLFGNARQWLVDYDAVGPLDVAGDCRELPFASDSIDAVLLVHQLEFTEAPHDVLREVCRIVSPEGWLINLGFNPYSLWGLRRALGRGGATDGIWHGRYVSRARVEDWLRVLGLSVHHREGLMLRPPLRNRRRLERLEPIERWGRHYARWLGGIHVTAARKHVAGVTPLAPVERPRLEVIPGGLAPARVRGAARRRSLNTERE